jgi:hypothetical protein
MANKQGNEANKIPRFEVVCLIVAMPMRDKPAAALKLTIAEKHIISLHFVNKYKSR